MTKIKIDIPTSPLPEALQALCDVDKPSTWEIIGTQLKSAYKFSEIPENDLLAAIARVRREGDLCLILGAGVSASVGLPTWPDLLNRVALQSLVDRVGIEVGPLQTLAKLFNSHFQASPLIAARILKSQYGRSEVESFIDVLREALYDGAKKVQDSNLLSEIAKICAATRKCPQVKAVISYNFDDLLETQLSELEIPMPYKALFDGSQDVKASELPIYHVHGYIPKDPKNKTCSNIVFAEDQYHNQYCHPYDWSNLVQLDAFRRSSCLMIGLSFNDPNMRRLLDVARREGQTKEHYLIKKRYEMSAASLPGTAQELEFCVSKIAPTEGEEIARILEKFEEIDAATFNVRILWVQSYTEIPEKLAMIRKLSDTI